MNIKNGWLITRISVYDKKVKELTDVETNEWHPFVIKINEIHAVKKFMGDGDTDECNGRALIYAGDDTFVLEESYDELSNYLVKQTLVLS